MKDKVRLTVLRQALFSKGDAVVAAVSGGADSMALLHLLCDLRAAWKLQLTVVHVNHGIRGAEAQRDADFVQQACAQLAVPFVLRTAEVPALAARLHLSLEACGRQERYRMLEEEAAPRAAWIATAHTLSDQTETVLLNLTRGTGLRGLCGIPYKRGRIIRPLLDCTRAEVEAFCRANAIAYVQDSTNEELVFARNRIRRQVIPQLKQINPQLEQSIQRMTAQLRAQEQELTERAGVLLARAKQPDGTDVQQLLEAPPVVCAKALLLLCAQNGVTADISEEHIRLLTGLLRGGGGLTLPGGCRVRCAGNRLHFCDALADPPAFPPAVQLDELPHMLEWDGRVFCFRVEPPVETKNEQKIYKISLSDTLNYDTISKSGQLIFRGRREGDRFTPVGRGVTKSLKKLLNEGKIPVGQRGHLALLEADGEIVWMEGFGVSESAKMQPGAARLTIMEEDANGKPSECGH